ncbi:MAG: acyl--CoA ligase [Bacteriodetes bacterium]|nr:acyl--CoA ligase [Bacteroidota bacterium]
MSSIQEKITQAQTTNGITPSNASFIFSSMAQALEHNLAERPDSPFIIYYSEHNERSVLTYSDFSVQVRKTASFLQLKGITKGGRVATAAHNHPDTIVQYFACWLLGACVVPLNMSEDSQRHTYILQNSNATVLLMREDYQTQLAQVLEHCTIETVAISTEYYQTIHQQPEHVLPQENMLDEEAMIVYTSGTTGNPKGVVLVQRNLMADGEGISQWHNITPDQRMMCVLPIHHVNGTIVTHVTPFLAGSSVVLNRKFQTEYFFQRIKDENVHVVSVVPTLLAFLLEAKQDSLGVQQQGFRHIICGAGPLTCELARQFEDTYNIPIMHGYGLSETTCYSCFLETSLTETQHRKWLLDYGFPSIGTPIPQNEMQIHDTNGNPLGEHERGEIVIRGWNVMKEYYQNDKANLETFQHSWFRSGDEGFWVNSPDGKPYFFITGRIKELFIRGGVNIAPLEIDEVINCAPGVKAGISVGFVNDFYGEEVGALVIPELNATQEEILAYCQKQLPFSKAPKVVLFTEQLPVTSTGKYQRNKVKHLFAEWQSHQFRKSK